jgi:hypothetical protein
VRQAISALQKAPTYRFSYANGPSGDIIQVAYEENADTLWGVPMSELSASH